MEIPINLTKTWSRPGLPTAQVKWAQDLNSPTAGSAPFCDVTLSNGFLFRLVTLDGSAVATEQQTVLLNPSPLFSRGVNLRGRLSDPFVDSPIYIPAFVYDACLNSTLRVLVREPIFDPYSLPTDTSGPPVTVPGLPSSGQAQSFAEGRYDLALGLPIAVGVYVSFNPVYIRRNVTSTVSILPSIATCDGSPETSQPPTLTATPQVLDIGRNCSRIAATPTALGTLFGVASTAPPTATLAGMDVNCLECGAGA
jgi:hypothetical protein